MASDSSKSGELGTGRWSGSSYDDHSPGSGSAPPRVGGAFSRQTHPYYWCESHVWNAPACLATLSLIFLFLAGLSTMFKVVRSFSKKAERKHESSGARSAHTNGSAGGGYYQNGSSSQHHQQAVGNGFGNGYGHHSASGGQLLAVDNRHLSHAQQAHQGFSESSSYETREHFERKVQKVKKSRGERERSRSARRGDEVDHFYPISGLLFIPFLDF